MCMMDYGEGWKVYREVHRSARKAYRCGECRRTIEPGERYHYATGLSYEWDGWSTYRTCAHCAAACEWLRVVCDGYLFTMVAEDLRNHVDGDESYMRSRPLTRLVRWQAARWRDRAGELRPVADVEAVTAEAIECARRTMAAPAA